MTAIRRGSGLVLSAWLLGCTPPVQDEAHAPAIARDDRPIEEPVATGASEFGGRVALELLAALPVREHGPKTGYARDQFGPAWADVDHNGCDTRNDILRRDLTDVRAKSDTRECVIAGGVLDDPYTGTNIKFERVAPSHIDIDHVVALSNAWISGAAEWPQAKRVALANDPLNLLAVDAGANRGKGDADAAGWLPANVEYRCRYVARQIAVKAKYGLAIAAREREAMERVLRACPQQLAPVGDAPVLASTRGHESSGETHTRDETTKPASRESASHESVTREPAKPTAPATGERKPDPDYGTCKNAKAHGAGPYHRDRDPEYRYYDDRDKDGIVCE